MTYLNPLLALGDQRHSPCWPRAKVSALVVPDLPEDEAGPISAEAARAGIDLALLVAPTSSPDALSRIGHASRGFVYVVGVVGTTGARRAADPALPAILSRARAHTALPLVAGFGLSEPSRTSRPSAATRTAPSSAVDSWTPSVRAKTSPH
jgi:tryptophan synthase alpha chain